MIKNMLDCNEHLQKLLFKRGYLLTSKPLVMDSIYPFYSNWDKKEIGKYHLYVHKDQTYYIQKNNEEHFVLVGHSYNPWDSVSDENLILKKIIESYKESRDSFFEELSKISGVFVLFIIKENEIIAVQDSAGIMPVFYTAIEEESHHYLSSHSQLIADLCQFSMDENIKKLVNSKFYLIGIRHLPGIKSPFKEVKMLTSNTYYCSTNSTVTRFYPNSNVNRLDEQKSLEVISEVLKTSMHLVNEKFNASLSLTGGTDSKMTLAAANGLYDKFKYFSFYSSEAEKKDAVAARDICKSLNIPHQIFKVPTENMQIKDFNLISKIIDHNTGYIKKYNDSELRKLSFLVHQKELNVDVRSLVSEISRGFYYSKFGLSIMPKPLQARHMSNFYKRNMFNRKLLKYMDEAFEEFINITKFRSGFSDRYDESDMFYWEHRMSQWAALVKQDFDISHETTIIYNNRKLLDTFMNFDLEDRVNDLPQKKITRILNKELSDLHINNKNAMYNDKRIYLERIFFEINSRLP